MAFFYTNNIAKLDDDLVLDGNFYRPEKISIVNKINNSSSGKISDYFFEVEELITTQMRNGIFPVINYDLPHSLGNILTLGNNINTSTDLGSTKKSIKSNDIIISRLRYYLKEIAIVPERGDNQVASTEYVVIRSKGNLSTHILLPYLLSSNIQYIFSCLQRGSAHPRLANKDILSLPLPDFLKKEKDLLTQMIESVLKNYESSLKLYPEAEQELLERLEWNNFNKKHKLSYKANINDISNNLRLDPEFYQPKFMELASYIKKKGSIQLLDFCSEPNRGVQPEYVENGNVLVINSKHLGTTQIDIENTERTSDTFYSDANNSKARLKKYDVLMYATGAYVGRTNVFLETEKTIASNHVTIIRPNAEICNPVYLALFLNSEPGLMQTDQRASGSAQREIYPQEIIQYKIFIPQNKNGKPDLEWQKKLADKVIQAYEAKKEAKKKLKEAVELVEREIEKIIA
ncbi:MAG: restriction endonuclease subunit S [Bacteroidales bacterium]